MRTLAQHDLVDEYRLMVYPTVLGEGKRLLGDVCEPSSLTLVEAKQMGEVITLTYTPARG